jgi:hypothetical protein
MLITINILSALSIVMALFIPYFILLHLNNKLRKEVEGALNRVLEVNQFTENLASDFFDFKQVSQLNFDSQDKNWNIYRDNVGSFKGAIRETSRLYDEIKYLPNKVSEIDRTLNKVIQRQLQAKNLKEILENPIEVKKQACETKLKLKEEVNADDIKTVTEIVNKVDFKHGKSNFEIGDVFRKTEDTVFISRDGKYIKILNLNSGFGKNIFNKFLQLNEN